MNKNKGNKNNDCRAVADALKFGVLRLPESYSMPAHKMHQESFTTVREKIYRGKSIRVETTYKITIAEEPVTTHTFVLDDGTVHCHAFPNYSFPSAMDLARKIIDTSDIDIPKDQLNKKNQHKYGGHK